MKTLKVKEVLLNRLGRENLNINGNKYEWTKEKNDDEVFECRLTNGRLRVFVNKEEVPNSFSKKIENLGKELKVVIAGNQTLKHKQRELERAQRELDRAKRNLERIKNKQN